jgi:predicted TIM-barrel fold metal-dependent hydrolase
MKPMDRRRFVKSSLLGAAAIPLAHAPAPAAEPASTSAGDRSRAPGIIDTNVNLFDWPFRALKYRDTKALVAKLRRHRVIEAWAGSFEALLAKDMNGVNTRLAAECREHGRGFMVPFGSVNLAWPDWEEDLRRCHEVHQMPGIRIYPGYQPFDLDHPGMRRLLSVTADRGLILQVVFGMEDPRVHHPILNVGPVTFGPLLQAIQETPKTRVQLLHFPGPPKAGSSQARELSDFMARPNCFMEISRLEGNGAVGRMLGSGPVADSVQVPVDRIVFGSHAPYFPVETAILKLVESPLEAEQLHGILQSNARRLLPRA